MIDKSYLLKKISALGVTAGDMLFVHSAFSAVGDVNGGPDAVIDALLEAVGPDGTLIFPTFTSSGKPFSLSESSSGTGILSEVFRKRPGVLRSRHPTHSVAAIGRHARELTGGAWATDTTCGEGTPYAYLARSEAKQMMLGVDLNRCTMLHAVEDMGGFAWLVPTVSIAPPVDAPHISSIHRYPPGHRALIHLMADMRRMEWFVQGYIGNARVLVYPIREMHDYCMERIKTEPFMFLCENPSCNSCAEMRGRASDPNLTGTCTETVCEVCRFTESYLKPAKKSVTYKAK